MKRIRTFSIALLAALVLPTMIASAQDVARTYSVNPGGILRLDIETGGSIDITGWDRNEVEINIYVSGRNGADVIVDLHEIRNGVSVATEYEGRNGRSDVDVEIKVPSVFDLDIETTGGDVQIDGVEGMIEGQTMGGDLDFTNLKGEIDFNTMGGEITLENSVIDGEVQTMGGEVRIEDVLGNVKGHTMGGEVTYRNVRANPDSDNRDELEISTMGGEINVDEAAYGATVHTMGGEINVNKAGDHVKATTMGGDITIEEVNGWVEASTMGGDVEVNMVGDPSVGDRHIEISSMGGDIDVTVPAGLAMDIELEIKLDGRNADDFEIVSDFELQYEERSGDSRWRGSSRNIYATGETGSGKRHRVEITTTGGNIYLRKGR